jgi:hypothetical protein
LQETSTADAPPTYFQDRAIVVEALSINDKWHHYIVRHFWPAHLGILHFEHIVGRRDNLQRDNQNAIMPVD